MLVGLFTDSHYHPVGAPGRLAVAEYVAGIMSAEGVSHVLALGDIYDYFTDLTEAQSTISSYESKWAAFAGRINFLSGNHDQQGISLEQYLNISSYAEKNFTFDLGNYRFICYFNSNVDVPNNKYFYADDDTLTWLTSELAKCQTGGIAADKKVIVCTHCYIYQDYPGNPVWWTSDPYSVFSYNAGAQRAIIEAGKAAGADLVAVFMGHAHSNTNVTVNTIPYYGFYNTGDVGSFALIDLGESSISITGINSQASYNRPLQYYVSPTGLDTNQGFIRSLPWKTMTKALSGAFTAGSTVNFMPGKYRETIFMARAGTAIARITWNFESDAIVTGADIITGFSLVGAEYQVALTTAPIVVLKDGVLMPKGSAAGSLTAGQWFWAANVLYIKDNPSGHVIEAGQRNDGMGFGGSSQYLDINGLEVYGCNAKGVNVGGAPTSVTINGANLRDNYSGIDDSSTATAGNVVVSNVSVDRNLSSGCYLRSSGATTIRNIKGSGNLIGLRCAGTVSAKITGALLTGNSTNISLETTGGSTVIANAISKGATIKSLNSTGAGTTEVKNSCINGTATWGTTIQTNIITNDPLVNSIGFLQRNSPCIDTGAWISGIGGNMSGELDYFGRRVYKLPNIGIDQGADAPKHKQRGVEITMASIMAANSLSKTIPVANPAVSYALPGVGNVAYLCNIGYFPCYVVIGTASSVAEVSTTASSQAATLIPSGTDRYLEISRDVTHISVICASGETTNLYVQIGDIY